jgi:hypothetical protein
MWVSLETIAYMQVAISTCIYISNSSKESHIHTWVSMVTGVYRFVQVSIGEVSAGGYFQDSLSGLKDDINRFDC